MSASLRRHWDAFWFRPVEATDLGFCRLVFFALLLLIVLPVDPSQWAAVPDVFWMPIPSFEILGLGVPSVSVVRVLDVVWKASLLTAALGLFTRSSAGIAFVLGFYLLGLPQNFGKIHHNTTVIVVILAILAVSRSGDAWSLDRIRSVGRSRRAGRAPESGEYRWPVRLVWTLMVLAFLSAGVAKLRKAGLDWALSENLVNLLLSHQHTHAPVNEWGLWVASVPGLPQIIATGSLLLELAAPLALVSRRVRRVVIPGLLSMQVGIWVLMNVYFFEYLLAYLFWVPWTRLGRTFEAAGGRLRSALPHSILSSRRPSGKVPRRSTDRGTGRSL